MSQVPTSSNAGNTAAPRPGGRTVAVPRPEQGAEVIVQSSPGGRLDFGFDPGEATAARPENSNDLVFDVEGGGKVTISGFFEVGNESLPTLSLPDGVEVAAADFFAGSDMDMTTAAGPGRASGSGTSYDDNAGSLLGGLDMYGKLGTDQWGRATENTLEIQGTEFPGGTFSFSVGTTGTETADDERPGAVPGGSYAGIFEDWKPNQHLDGDAAVTTPARLEMSFTPTGTTVVDNIALSGFTVGSEIYIGDPNVVAPVVIATPGQVVNLTPGQIAGGVYIKPPLNDDTDMNINAQVTLRAASGGRTEVVDGSFTIVVDAAADRPENVQGVADDTHYAPVTVDMDESAVKSDDAGWKKTEFDAGHGEAVSVEIPVTLTATFSDFDGSESHTLYIAVPQPAGGWTALGPDGQALNIVDDVPGREGQAFYEVHEGQITFDADGNAQAELIFRHEAGNLADSDAAPAPLAVVAVTRETPTDSELADVNNTALTVSEDQVSLIVNNINAGLTIQAGWGSEGADDSKHLASDTPASHPHEYTGAEKDATDDGSAPVLISITDNGSDYITSVTLTWNTNDGTLNYNGANGTAAYEVDGDKAAVTITFAPGQATTTLGDDLRFIPAADTDSTDVHLGYTVVVNNGTGAEAVYKGGTTVVVDAVADRGATGELSVGYEDGASAVAPGDVVKVSGSVVFNDTDGSELHYAVISVPDAAWSIGYPSLPLLGGDAVKELWKEKAYGDNAAKSDENEAEVDGALAGAIPAGQTGPFLLIEADSATGTITIYVADNAGNALALSHEVYADLYRGITYDQGTLNWTVPVETPRLTEDGSLAVGSWGVSVEKTPDDGEYDYANNISAGDVKTATVEVDVVIGSLNINPDLTNTGLYEDNQPNQWTNADGDTIVTDGSGPDTTGGLPGYDPQFGIALFALQGGGTSEYVQSITFDALPDASEGTLYYKGVELTGQGPVTVTDPSGAVDLSELTFKPAENYSGNVDITYTAELASSATGQVVPQGEASITVHVESVADLADADIRAVTQDTVQGDFLDVKAEDGKAEEAPAGGEAQYTGWYVSHADNETPVSAALDLTTTLRDLDGSEHAQILVQVGTGTGADDFAGNGINVVGHMDNLVFIDGNAYAVFAEGEASGLVNADGNGTFTLPLLVDHGKTAPVHVIVRTEESGASTAGNQTGNDVAMRGVASAELPLSWLSAGMDIKTGWVSEGQDNAKYLESGTHAFNSGSGFDAASTVTGGGAPVSVTFADTDSIDGITFTYKASDGELLVDGRPIAGISTYIENGVEYCRIIIGNNPAQGSYNPFNYLQGGRLTFKPADGLSDADISLNYQVEVNEGSHKFLVYGETTVVVDAVADHADITGGVAAMDTAVDADAGAVVVTVDAVFADNDGSEKHYVLVERPNENWACTDAGAELVTVYFDAGGRAIAPTWNPETQSYDEPTSGASSKEFFRVEVTGDAGGSYQVHLTPPAGADDVTVKTGTLAVEQVDYSGADGKVNEYDYSNNHAYDFARDPVTVDLLNSGLSVGPASAYEDHDKDVSTNYKENTGDTEPGDGAVILTISGGGEILDTADGKEFTLTFEFPAGKTPGTFTIGGVKYTPTDNDDDGTWELSVPAASLGGAYNSGAGTISLFYNPPRNDDTDLGNLNFSVPVKAGDSGFTDTLTTKLETLVVDAVADKPTVATIVADYEGDRTAAKPGEELTLNLGAAFTDLDGSEEHSVIVQLPAGFGTPSYAGSELTALSAERIAELNGRGAGLDPNGTYYEIEVAGTAGAVDIPLTVTAPNVIATSGSGDSSYAVKVIAHSHETATGATESTLDNNDAFTTGTATVNVGAVVDNADNPNKGYGEAQAYEDHKDKQHEGNQTENTSSGKIGLTHDASDQVDTLVLTCSKEEAGEGYLTYNGVKASTTNPNFTVEEVDGKLVYTIKSDGGSDPTQGLRFNPGPDSDGDVKFQWTADVHDKASGYSAGGTEDWKGEFTVKVDAVADKPVGAAIGTPTYTDLDGDTHVQSTSGSGVPGGTVAFTVSASFGDYADGSENQYLVVQRPSASWKAEGSDGLLVAGGKTYFRYDVTGEIDAAAAFKNGNSVSDGFTVVLNPDGSYTVSSAGSPDVRVSFGSDGRANVGLTAELLIPDNAGTKTDIQAGGVSIDRGAVDSSTGAISFASPDGEITTDNNVGADLKGVTVILGTVESGPVVSVGGFVFENNDPNAHLSDLTAANEHGPEWNEGRTIEADKIAEAGATIHVEGIADGETGYLTLSFSAVEPNGSPTDLGGATVSFDGNTYILVEDPNNAGSYTTARAVEDPADPGSFIPDGGPVPIPVGPTGSAGVDLTFTPAPNNSGIDIAVKADVTVEDHNSGREQTFNTVDAGTIEVDAAAQAADVEAGTNQVSHTSDVVVHGEVTFKDFEDGSENHYILVEAVTGIGKPSYITLYDNAGNVVDTIQLPANIGWEPVDSIGLFWRIPLDNAVIEQYGGKLSVDVGFHEIASWRYGAGIDMRFGALSEERVEAMDGERFHSGTPGDNNNVAHVIDPDVIHVTVPGSGSGGGSDLLLTVQAYEDGEPNSHVDDHTQQGAEIDLSKISSELTGQIGGGHEGDTIEYKGTVYAWLDDGNGNRGFTSDNGSTFLQWDAVGTDEKILFMPGGQDDKDRFLTSSKGTIWVQVDAVADLPDVSRTSYIDAVRSDGGHYAAALSEGKVIAATELHFDDTDGSETHYAVLQKHPQWKLDSLRVTMDLDGDGADEVYTWTPNGWTDSNGNPLPDIGATVTTVFGSDGIPYYAVQLPDNVEDAEVEFIINAPKTDEDLSQPLKIGGIARENATGAGSDAEAIFDNNWAEGVKNVTVSVAVVETKALTAGSVGELTEDDTVSGITLHFEGFADTGGAVDSTYADNNPERITSLDLVITQSGSGNGVRIGTIRYDGVEYPVTVGADGTAKVSLDFGDGGYDESKFSFVMAEGNHNGQAVTIKAKPTVTDVDSGDKVVLDEIKVTVDPKDIADEATSVAVGAVDHNTGLAGIQDYAQPGGTISFTASAQFPDADGSENHYILVEAKPGWICNNSGATTIYLNDQGEKVGANAGGTAYFKIPASAGATGSVTVNLKVPSSYTEDMLDEDGKAVALNVGALAEEKSGGDYAVHFDTGSDADTVKVQVGAVQAVGVGFNADGTGVHEDGVASDGTADSAAGAKLTISITGGTGYDADAAHEELTALTVNLQGGRLVYADGTVASTTGNLTPAQITQALNGELYYQPAANVGGDIRLSYSAVIKDVNSGAAKTVTGSDTVTVTAVTDRPGDVSAQATYTEAAGHQANVSVTLTGNFADIDGSENHFFLVSMPAGAIVPNGWTAASAELAQAAGFAAGETVYFVDVADNRASASGNLQFKLPDNFEGDIRYRSGAYEKDGSPVDYKFSGSGLSTAHLETGDINAAPNVPDDAAVVSDILRSATPSTGGTLKNMTDVDGDDVDVTGVSSQNNPTATVVEDDGKLIVEGRYGILSIDKETGSYTYTLKPEYQGENGVGLNGMQDKFTVDVADDYGTPGVDTAVITVTLGAPNTAPTANAERLEVGGGNETDTPAPALVDSGNLHLSDADGDPVAIAPDAGWTPLNDGGGALSGWRIDGKYGTLTLNTDGSYTYKLTNEHVNGTEQFTVNFADKFGSAGQPAVITVNVAAVNHAPEVNDAEMHLTSKDKGMWIGNVKQHYSDSDAAVGHQGDVLAAALTALDASGELRTVIVPESGSVSMELQYGTLTVLASGQYTYVAHDQAGAHMQNVWDSVTLTVTDSGGLSSSGTLNFALGNPDGPAPRALGGTDAAESLAGTADADVIYGGAGDDAVDGGAGNDILSGGAGNDSIDGGEGNDVVYGGAGNDTINGGAGNDTLSGGAGNDTINGGAGDDVVRGGEGSDTIYGGEGNDTIYAGADGGVVSGGAGNDLLIVEPGHGAAEFLWKGEDVGNYHDTIRGFDVELDTIKLSDIIGDPADIGSLLQNADWNGDTHTLTVNGGRGSLTAAAADNNTLVLRLKDTGGGEEQTQTITIETSGNAFAGFNMDTGDAAVELLKQMIKDG
jgi:VCBS repeat-containing protein